MYSMHPLFDRAAPNKATAKFDGGTLVCACADHPVKVHVTSEISHNHACGCTKCWKPENAALSVVAVAPTANIQVIENGNKLEVIDPAALIQRHACKQCGVHMHGPVTNEHPFQGLTFIHPERFAEAGWPAPTFAAFVSSVIESGFDPEKMDDLRSKLRTRNLEPYDCLSPSLMDYIATWSFKHKQ